MWPSVLARCLPAASLTERRGQPVRTLSNTATVRAPLHPLASRRHRPRSVTWAVDHQLRSAVVAPRENGAAERGQREQREHVEPAAAATTTATAATATATRRWSGGDAERQH